MEQKMKTKLIPTNHLMSKAAIEGILKDEGPEVIGIELCEFREASILDNQEIENIKENKNEGLLGKITSKINQKAKEQNLDYGSDMKTALKYSIENNIPRVLVDMPILKIQELFSKIPKEEQKGFAKELTEFESESLNKKVNEEEVLTQLKKRYPIAFEFLVNMRNLYIANQILKAEKEYPGKRIIIILGSAHVQQVSKLIGGQNG